MGEVSARELLRAGAHFGHKVSGSNPKMNRFVYARRNKVEIIDIRYTIKGIIEAAHFLQEQSRSGGKTLFVGTKRQARGVLRREAERSGSFFVTERWLGGTLTNMATIRRQVRRLQQFEMMEKDGTLEDYTKKMVSKFNRDKRKLIRNLEGIRSMDSFPSALVVIDPQREANAVAEAYKLSLPIIALVDTDADPDPIDITIPVNDDAVRVIDVVMKKLSDAIIKGKTLTGRFTPPGEGAASFSSDDLDAAAPEEDGEEKTEPKTEAKAEAEAEAKTDSEEKSEEEKKEEAVTAGEGGEEASGKE